MHILLSRYGHHNWTLKSNTVKNVAFAYGKNINEITIDHTLYTADVFVELSVNFSINTIPVLLSIQKSQ